MSLPSQQEILNAPIHRVCSEHYSAELGSRWTFWNPVWSILIQVHLWKSGRNALNTVADVIANSERATIWLEPILWWSPIGMYDRSLIYNDGEWNLDQEPYMIV